MESESMIYRSANFTYCSSSDATCASCHSEWSLAYADSTADPNALCVGTDGCICVAACELPDRDSLIVASMCPDSTAPSSNNYGLAATREMEEREARREARRPVALANVPQLNLGGWTGLQDKLVETEHSQLGIDAKPTLSSTAATAVTIEEGGEGYRPLSPSDRHPRQRDL
ncbi:hypothetical protein BBJ28_00022679 [Nothophytophthora sp. Chile5]|nr:hypothetical protein BBJ28_00022679 [Nothophytophthora sp. Chile5]